LLDVLRKRIDHRAFLVTFVYLEAPTAAKLNGSTKPAVDAHR
jgi:hypothetical protein